MRKMTSSVSVDFSTLVTCSALSFELKISVFFRFLQVCSDLIHDVLWQVVKTIQCVVKSSIPSHLCLTTITDRLSYSLSLLQEYEVLSKISFYVLLLLPAARNLFRQFTQLVDLDVQDSQIDESLTLR